MKSIYCCLIIPVLFSACISSNCTLIPLSKEDKLWVNCYKEGDMLTFVSDKNQTDTFIVSADISYTPCNKFELGDFQYQRAAVQLKSNRCHGNSSTYCDIQLNFSKSVQKTDEPCAKIFSVFDLESSGIKDLKDFPVESVTLKGSTKSYSCYVFQQGDGKTWSVDNDGAIKAFYWSRLHGLIKYVTVKNEVFELVL